MIFQGNASRTTAPRPFQSIRGLGDPVRTYGLRGRDKALVIAITTGIMVSGAAMAYFGMVVLPRTFPEIAMQPVLPIMGGGFFLLVGAFVWTWSIMGRWNEMVTVFHDGIACSDGENVRSFRWGEIAGLQARGTAKGSRAWRRLFRRPTYSIVTDDGYLVTLDRSIPHVEDLYEQICARSKPFLLARCQRMLQMGQSVPFGALSMSADGGIHKGARIIPWEDIEDVSVAGGTLRIQPLRRGLLRGLLSRGMSVPVDKITNLHVLLAMTSDVAAAVADESDQEEDVPLFMAGPGTRWTPSDAYPLQEPHGPQVRPSLIPASIREEWGPKAIEVGKRTGKAVVDGAVTSFQIAMPVMDRAVTSMERAYPGIEKALGDSVRKAKGFLASVAEYWPTLQSSLQNQFGITEAPPKAVRPRAIPRQKVVLRKSPPERRR